MELITIIVARSVWLFNILDLNPKGRALEDVTKWLAAAYSFQKFPLTPNDLHPEKKGLVFTGGKFKSGDEYVTVDLDIYNDGVVVNGRSSTDDNDRFIDEILRGCVEHFGLVYPKIGRKIYYSEMDVRISRPMTLLNPSLEHLANRLTELKGDSPAFFGFAGISFLPSPPAQPTTPGFLLERKVNTDFSENRYYTRAPLQTNAHLEFIREIEAAL